MRSRPFAPTNDPRLSHPRHFSGHYCFYQSDSLSFFFRRRLFNKLTTLPGYLHSINFCRTRTIHDEANNDPSSRVIGRQSLNRRGRSKPVSHPVRRKRATKPTGNTRFKDYTFAAKAADVNRGVRLINPTLSAARDHSVELPNSPKQIFLHEPINELQWRLF